MKLCFWFLKPLKVVAVLLYYLTVYPEVQRKLQEEIDDVLENKDEDQEIDADDITNMSYLDQVKQKEQIKIILVVVSTWEWNPLIKLQTSGTCWVKEYLLLDIWTFECVVEENLLHLLKQIVFRLLMRATDWLP